MTKNAGLNNDLDIAFSFEYSLTSLAGASDAVRLQLDWWVIGAGQAPNIASPTGTQSVDLSVASVAGNVLAESPDATFTVPKADFAGTGTEQRIVFRLTRHITGAPVNYVAGSFDLIALIPALV